MHFALGDNSSEKRKDRETCEKEGRTATFFPLFLSLALAFFGLEESLHADQEEE